MIDEDYRLKIEIAAWKERSLLWLALRWLINIFRKIK